MYLDFYNMTRAPFHITPDPDFLYLSPSHKEAFGAIIYCIQERKGFVAVFGEVGTGKTTIIRSYLAKVNRSKINPIYLFNPSITFGELLKTVLRELGVRPASHNVSDMVTELHRILVKEFVQNRSVVLIIDEAQNMPVETFEQLRILSNLETTKEKLLQIILVGQPELAEKLARKELRQLNQRMAIKATLSSLSNQESRDYIFFRLSKVTTSPKDVFTDRALAKLIKVAKGSPRMLNIMCDNALIAGFGYRKKPITASVVTEVIRDFEGQRRLPAFSWKFASIILGTILLFVSVFNEMNTPISSANFDLWQNHIATAKYQDVNVMASNKKETAASEAVPAPEKKFLNIEADKGLSPLTGASQTISTPESTESETAPPPEIIREEPPHKVSPVAENNIKPAVLLPAAAPRQMVNGRLMVRRVRKGESLSQICLEMYGYVDDHLIEAIKLRNPGIHNADLIITGETIFLPKPVKVEWERERF